jgi:hypothetical protein
LVTAVDLAARSATASRMLGTTLERYCF